MTESKKIQNLLDKYKPVIENTDMDVCQSMKGRWYFLRYNQEDDYYDCFREFDTASEFIKILLGELAMDMFCLIDEEDELSSDDYKFEDLCDMLDSEIDYTKTIKELVELMNQDS